MSLPVTPLEGWIAAKVGAPRLSRAALRSNQLRKLREVVAYARERSPFYRGRLAHLPDDPIRSLDDLTRLPFTTATDLVRDGLQLLCVSQGDIARVTTLPTSGTTGAPKRLYFTEADLERTADFFHHGMSTLVEPGQRVLVLMPGARPGTVGDLLAKGLARMDVATFVYGFVDEPGRVLEEIEALEIDALVGVPVQVLGLARHPGAARLAPDRLKAVLLSSDFLAEPVARAVAEAFGCLVFDHYGMTEMGLGGGVQCRALRGYHLREADLLVEVVDPASGLPVPDGDRGEVVFTTLTRTGMPLLRYRTGDLSRFLPEPCPCETSLPALEQVRGRLDGAVRIAGGGVLSMPELDEAVFPLEPVVDFTAAVSREDDRDHLALRVCSAAGTETDGLSASVEGAVASIPGVRTARAKDRLTLSVAVSPWDAGRDGRPGKRRIADLREPTAELPREVSPHRIGKDLP